MMNSMTLTQLFAMGLMITGVVAMLASFFVAVCNRRGVMDRRLIIHNVFAWSLVSAGVILSFIAPR